MAEFTGVGIPAWVFPLLVLLRTTALAAAGALVSGGPRIGLILALSVLIVATAILAAAYVVRGIAVTVIAGPSMWLSWALFAPIRPVVTLVARGRACAPRPLGTVSA